jgi:uncharacterized cupin superfamily protein
VKRDYDRPVEARLVDVGSGLAPADEGWFVVGAREAAWLRNDMFGWHCVFEANPPVVRGRPGLEPTTFPQLGITLAVLEPGKPSGLYHAESKQEDFLVLAGECLLLIEKEERRLHAWDFVHCPPGTAHAFIGGGEPCVLLMVGARGADKRIAYPRSEPAIRHGAGVEEETDSPREAYAAFPHWERGRPEALDTLLQMPH